MESEKAQVRPDVVGKSEGHLPARKPMKNAQRAKNPRRRSLIPSRFIPYEGYQTKDCEFSLDDLSTAISRKCQLEDYPHDSGNSSSTDQSPEQSANEISPKNYKSLIPVRVPVLNPVKSIRERGEFVFANIIRVCCG